MVKLLIFIPSVVYLVCYDLLLDGYQTWFNFLLILRKSQVINLGQTINYKWQKYKKKINAWFAFKPSIWDTQLAPFLFNHQFNFSVYICATLLNFIARSIHVSQTFLVLKGCFAFLYPSLSSMYFISFLQLEANKMEDFKEQIYLYPFRQIIDANDFCIPLFLL